MSSRAKECPSMENRERNETTKNDKGESEGKGNNKRKEKRKKKKKKMKQILRPAEVGRDWQNGRRRT
jgi:hypothetical protein